MYFNIDIYFTNSNTINDTSLRANLVDILFYVITYSLVYIKYFKKKDIYMILNAHDAFLE
jgi:hypothetical protein